MLNHRSSLAVSLDTLFGPDIASLLMLAIEQRDKGITNYGVALEDANLTSTDLLQHAREEMIDGAVYLTRLQAVVKQEVADARRAAVTGLMDELAALIEGTSQNTPEFQLLAIKQWMGGYAPPEHVRPVPVYVQPSTFEDFTRGHNLLTLSRKNTFPFTKKVELCV